MQNPVVIFGLGDFASKARAFFLKDSPYEVVAFTVEEEYVQDGQFLSLPVVPFEQIVRSYPPDKYDMFVAVGYTKMNKARAEICGLCKSRGYRLVSYVSSDVCHWDDLQIGENCFISRQTTMGLSVRIGDGVVIHTGNHIGEDTVFGDYSYVSAGSVFGGKVTIGPYSFIGMNATIRDHVTVAPECVIGAGVVILHDTVPKGVYRSPKAELLPITSNQLSGI